jgi:hypothetical protein
MDYKLNYKLYSILNGYYHIVVNNKKYKVIYPSLEVKYRGEELYVEIMEDSKYDTEYLDNDQLDNILRYQKIWNNDMQERLDSCTKIIEQYKMELYKEYFNGEKRDQIRKILDGVRSSMQELSEIKHSMDYLKLEFFASSMKNQYIISQRIFNLDGSQVFDEDYRSLDSRELSKFLKPIEEKTVTAKDLRDIVKGDAWSAYTVQDKIFGPSIDLNDDQRNLLALQRMYNNVRQHPECPSDEIIDDDDALDGWFLFQKDKQKKEKVKNSLLSKVRGKIKDHSSVFIFTQDEEERKAIWEMNDIEGKRTLKSIEKTMEERKGERIAWQDIPVVKQQIIEEKSKGSKI